MNSYDDEKAMTVAIIGAGASGLLLATHLSRNATQRMRVFLIDKSGEFGRGVAYGTSYSEHLLNVPAAKMSAFPDEPLHFLNWMRGLRPTQELEFVPRKIYGDYLQSLLPEQAVVKVSGNAHRVELLEPPKKRYRIHIEKNDPLEADILFLALGNLPPGQTQESFRSIENHPGYIDRVWQSGALEKIGKKARVLIVGSGLTMVDIVTTLKNHGHIGKVLAISRRGFLPQSHFFSDSAATQASPFTTGVYPQSLCNLLKTFRRAIISSEKMGSNWRAVVDSVRPQTAAIWKNLPLREKKRFLRHLRPFWDSHRHRMAPHIHQQMVHFIKTGEVEVRAARIESFEIIDSKIRAYLRRRGDLSIEDAEFDFIVNCTGTECDFRRAEDPLLKSLLANKCIQPDEMGMGLSVSENGVALVDGKPTQSLFLIGPLRKGTLWETTAIPEIRVQAQKVVAHFLMLNASSQPGT